MARSRSTATKVATAAAASAPLDPFSPVAPDVLNIAQAIRFVVGFLADGRVLTYLVYNPAEEDLARRRRQANSDSVLGLLRRICRDSHTLTAAQVEALLLQAGRIAMDFDPATPADAAAADYVKRMLCTSGLFKAVQVQKVPAGLKSTAQFPDVPLACLGTLADLGVVPPPAQQAAAPVELTEGGMPLESHAGAQPVTV